MIDMLKRHEIQVLRRAGHTWAQVAELTELSPSTFRILAREFSSRRVTSRVVLKERCQRLADHHPDADHVPPAATL